MVTGQAHGQSEQSDAAIGALITAAFEDHSSAIYGTALRATRDPDLAADVTQEAFVRLFGEARRGRMPDNVRGWLFRASANLIISRARRVSVAQRWAPRLVRRDGPAEPAAIAELHEEQGVLVAALATLSTVDRLALVMAAQGLGGEEIASHLGRSHAATRTLLSRARVRLRAAVLELDEAARHERTPGADPAQQAPRTAAFADGPRIAFPALVTAPVRR